MPSNRSRHIPASGCPKTDITEVKNRQIKNNLDEERCGPFPFHFCVNMCKQYIVHSCKGTGCSQDHAKIKPRSNISRVEMHPIGYPMCIPFAPLFDLHFATRLNSGYQTPTCQWRTGRAFGWLIACGQLGFMLGVGELCQPASRKKTWLRDGKLKMFSPGIHWIIHFK